MKRNCLLICTTAALVVILLSGFVWGAAFQLPEQNASGMGNAYAGSAATAENASTIFFNPAGMTQLQAREFILSLTILGVSRSGRTINSTMPGSSGSA
ncbi:MAG: outer membrane protein transport protein [Syntrophales bacterium]